MVYDCAIADTQKELLELVTYSPEVQCLIAEKIAAGEAETVAQGAVLVGLKTKKEALISPVETQVKKMWSSWEKMEEVAKQQFILKLKDEGII